jgi:hypothetical protein
MQPNNHNSWRQFCAVITAILISGTSITLIQPVAAAPDEQTKRIPVVLGLFFNRTAERLIVYLLNRHGKLYTELPVEPNSVNRCVIRKGTLVLKTLSGQELSRRPTAAAAEKTYDVQRQTVYYIIANERFTPVAPLEGRRWDPNPEPPSIRDGFNVND